MIGTFVAFDLETTGLKRAEDAIIEIGAVKVENWKIKEKLDIFVQPGCEISPFIQNLTGISQKMADQGQTQKEAAENFKKFCEGDYYLVGHNLMFDYTFMKYSMMRNKLSFERDGVDTLAIAKVFLAGLEKRSLEYLQEYYDIPNTHQHRAVYDALATAHLYHRLAKQFLTKESVKNFEPKPLSAKIKEEKPATARQLQYLQSLVEAHGIVLKKDASTLTKSEASRTIDKIISEHGKAF